MERTILTLMAFVAMALPMEAQPPVICSTCDTLMMRSDHYYYNGWYDTCDCYFTGPADNPISPGYQTDSIRLYGVYIPNETTLRAKRMYTPRPLQVKGLMAMVSINAEGRGFMDPSKLPEYMYLFQSYTADNCNINAVYMSIRDSVVLLDSVRWDTVSQPYILKFRLDANVERYDYCYGYEVYFDKPITVDSFFLIAGTGNSNTFHSIDDPSNQYFVTYYIPTWYKTPLSLGQYDGRHCGPSHLNTNISNSGRWLSKFSNYDRWCIYGGDNWWGAWLPIVDNWTVTAEPDSAIHGYVVGGGPYPDQFEASLRAVPNHGFHFSHWNDGSLVNPRTLTVTQDTVFTAYFYELDRYIVNVQPANPDQGSTAGAGIYYMGDVATLTATPAQHYRFQQWNDGITDNPRFITVEQDTAFSALFSIKKQYFVTTAANNDSYGTVSGSGQYFEDDTATLTAIPAYPYKFSNWQDGDTNNPRLVVVKSDTVLVANFRELDVYNVSVESNNRQWGTVSGGGLYHDGDTATLSASPTSNQFTFLCWSDENTDNPRLITVTQNISLSALFGRNTSVDEAPDAVGLSVAPNPAHNRVRVSCEVPMSLIALLDATGRTVMTVPVNGTLADIDVSTLAAGTYYISASTDRGTATRKLVIE